MLGIACLQGLVLATVLRSGAHLFFAYHVWCWTSCFGGTHYTESFQLLISNCWRILFTLYNVLGSFQQKIWASKSPATVGHTTEAYFPTTRSDPSKAQTELPRGYLNLKHQFTWCKQCFFSSCLTENHESLSIKQLAWTKGFAMFRMLAHLETYLIILMNQLCSNVGTGLFVRTFQEFSEVVEDFQHCEERLTVILQQYNPVKNDSVSLAKHEKKIPVYIPLLDIKMNQMSYC